MANDRYRNQIKASMLRAKSEYIKVYSYRPADESLLTYLLEIHDDDLPEAIAKYGDRLKDILGNDLTR